MMRVLVVLCAVVFGAALSHQSQAQPASPTDIEAFFDDTISALMEGTGIPGVTLSVVQNGEVVVLKGYGVADIKTGEPLDPEKTAVRIGSITKPLTAIAALQQVDAGTLDLDADINQYLFPYQVPDTYAEPVTAHHILTHQSGFDVDISYLFGPRFETEKLGAEEVERRLIRIRRPGEVASYDNLGFGVLGLAIEGASGRSYEKVVEEDIFRPLGMTGSYIGLPPERAADLAGCHLWSSPDKVWSCRHDAFSDLSKSAGAAVSTASDMAKLMLWLLDESNRESAAVLSPESFADLNNFDNYRHHPMSPGISRALMEYNISGRRGYGHNGGLNGFMSDMSLFPHADIGFFVSLSGTPDIMANLRLSDLVGQAQRAPTPEAVKVLQEKFNGLKKAFAEEFVPEFSAWPPKMSGADAAKLESIDIQNRVPGIYRGLRNTTTTFLVKLASGAQGYAITTPSDNSLLSSVSGLSRETAPLYFEHEENETARVIVPMDKNTYVFSANAPVGGMQRHPSYTSPTLTLLPAPIALLILLSGVVYLLPRFAGDRRRIAGFGLLGAALVLSVVLLELEYATWFELVKGNSLIPMLWRLSLVLGLAVLLMTTSRIIKVWRGHGYGTGWRSVVQKGHGALIAASCLTVVCLSAYWAAA
ncbi:MAG: serine hydrolase [Alphaproteobacteria bacterium]|nr:serine hydrolase [Alphaproteobacteria bacterium]